MKMKLIIIDMDLNLLGCNIDYLKFQLLKFNIEPFQ